MFCGKWGEAKKTSKHLRRCSGRYKNILRGAECGKAGVDIRLVVTVKGDGAIGVPSRDEAPTCSVTPGLAGVEMTSGINFAAGCGRTDGVVDGESDGSPMHSVTIDCFCARSDR